MMIPHLSARKEEVSTLSDTPQPTKKQLNIRTCIIIPGIHVLGAWAVIRLVLAFPSTGECAKLLILFGVFYFVPLFGITIGYHRLETHGGFKCGPVLRTILLIMGAMAVQGHLYGWKLIHRRHHAKQDQPGLDPHTPFEYPGIKGILWAHIGWMLCKSTLPPEAQASLSMRQDALVMWQRRWYPALVAIGFVVPFAVAGWNGIWIAGVLRLVISLHFAWFTNSLNHLVGKPAVDSQGNQYMADNSRNIWWLGPLSGGEGYHGDHHADQRCAFHGWRWYDLDPSKWIIIVWERLGLVRAVVKPKPNIVFTPYQRGLAEPPSSKEHLAAAV